MKTVYCILFVLYCLNSHSQALIGGEESPQIRRKQNSDSLFVEIAFNTASPIAAKLYFIVDQTGRKTAEVVTYTHRYRDKKLFTQSYSVGMADSLLQEFVRNENQILFKADNIEGYIVDWLDGNVWSITIQDWKGIRQYDYPELFEQPNKADIKRIQHLFAYLDSTYGIEEKRINMKLNGGKYYNFGETIIELR